MDEVVAHEATRRNFTLEGSRFSKTCEENENSSNNRKIKQKLAKGWKLYCKYIVSDKDDSLVEVYS